MKKIISIWILATMLFAVPTNVDAQTKRTTTRKTTTTAKRTTPVKKTTTPVSKPKPQMVDMGLSVKWSNIDLGAATTKSSGSLSLASTDISKACGEGWRLPTLADFNELLVSCDRVILEQNGVPSCIEFTSKNNGAKLYFYFPKTALKNAKTGKAVNNPYNGLYVMYIHLSDGQAKVFSVMNFNKYEPRFKALLNRAGLSKVKYTEWPNDVLKAINYESLSQQGAMFSYYADWLGTSADTDLDADAKALIRPVYAVDDDE